MPCHLTSGNANTSNMVFFSSLGFSELQLRSTYQTCKDQRGRKKEPAYVRGKPRLVLLQPSVYRSSPDMALCEHTSGLWAEPVLGVTCWPHSRAQVLSSHLSYANLQNQWENEAKLSQPGGERQAKHPIHLAHAWRTYLISTEGRERGELDDPIQQISTEHLLRWAVGIYKQ